MVWLAFSITAAGEGTLRATLAEAEMPPPSDCWSEPAEAMLFVTVEFWMVVAASARRSL